MAHENPDGSGAIEIELHPPYATMLELYRDSDRNLEIVLDRYAAEGIKPTCQRGCAACCHQLVMATAAEAGIAAGHLLELPDGDRQSLDARLALWLEDTADLRRRLQESADGDLEAVTEELAAAYWQRRIACPFLAEGNCAIYAVRPLACRHHFSVSEPDLCRLAPDGVVERMVAVEEAFFASQDAIFEEQAEIGIFPELVWLLSAREPGPV